jgi:RHS repeat-associated protein
LRREADGSYWRYEYDSLGQVISGKKYWSDGTPVPGQQFEYAFDDIGNRTGTKAGGDANGANLRNADYSANLLNQYTSRTVPGVVDVMGVGFATNTVTVNSQATYRKGEYFRKEVSVSNSSVPVWQSITVLAAGQTNIAGNVLVPRANESFWHDSDGNLLSDSLWTNTWNAENRLVEVESAVNVPGQARMREEWTHLPDGRWIQRIVSTNSGGVYYPAYTNRFVWDRQVLLAILDHTNGVVASFMRGSDLSGSIQGAGGVGGVLAVNFGLSTLNLQPSTPFPPSTHMVSYDGNGNVVALHNAADGVESAAYEYGPFSESIRVTGPVASLMPLRFSTMYEDNVTGDRKYLFRDYTPSTGRWKSRDPAEEEGGLNVYCFANNDGIDAYDILGLTTRTFPLYRLPYLKKPVLAYADVNVWRSSQGPILIKVRVWRNSDEKSRRDWNNFTAWPGMPPTWDAQHQWLWPNMASLLNARGSRRYGEPDPSRDNMDAAFFGAVAMPEGGDRPAAVSADWLNDNGVVDKQAISHSAFLNPGFAISVSECSDPPPIGFWLVFPDGSRGGAPGGGWPSEWDGTVYLYTKITWNGGEAQFDVPDGPPPASPMANLWESWKNHGATPRFIY